MNQKKCKALRKQAKLLASQEKLPTINYGHSTTKVNVLRMNSQGVMEPTVETRVTRFLDACLRLVYKNLKKTFSKGVAI